MPSGSDANGVVNFQRALAIRMQELVDRGEVAHYAELARLAHVSRTRISQIMRLTLLAPGIQDGLLFLAQPIPVVEIYAAGTYSVTW